MQLLTTHLTLPMAGGLLLIGMMMGILYYLMLWYSLKILLRIKRRGVFLFVSAAVRIFMLIFIALYAAQNEAGRFLLVIAGFIITRIVCLRGVKQHLKNIKGTDA